ncbi:jg23893 [Pararge aegeria aegeria]|uniref:Jg23893 protein n=1 Tax=Pararge aegeria aegeria TaxID=348720 RepID=A0A8S4S7V6_9NEOP|nr:jg23893 [Pararge aegeria aegeria]
MCGVLPNERELQRYKNNPSVKKLQEYIRIDTSTLENVELTVQFWKRQAEELGLLFNVYRPGRLPVCVTTLRGRKPELPSILLNSHSDVVPVDTDLWTYPPFSAHIDDNGDLYGRGAQDTKGVSIQYMDALRKIIHNNITLERTVHVMVVPDEETGSFGGLKPFIETDEFKSLNIGFALDEGLTSSDNTMAGTYVDKRPWHTIQDMGFNIVPVVCPATSDMILLREIGIPAIGFSSRTNIRNKLHDTDEYIPIDNFLRGTDIYVALIKSLANLPEGNSKYDHCDIK